MTKFFLFTDRLAIMSQAGRRRGDVHESTVETGGEEVGDYIEKRGDAHFIAGSRVSLDSVVGCFLEGLAPETIVAECFPTLTLEQVYGSIKFYLANRTEIDAYLSASESGERAFRAEIRARYPHVHNHLDALLASTGTRER